MFFFQLLQGNIFALKDGRIAYVDFGNVAQLSQTNKEVLIDAVVHAVNEDYDAMAVSLFYFVCIGNLTNVVLFYYRATSSGSVFWRLGLMSGPSYPRWSPSGKTREPRRFPALTLEPSPRRSTSLCTSTRFESPSGSRW